MSSFVNMLPIDLWTQTACIWEATARKPGNVTPFHSFSNLTYVDLVLSAAAVGPILHSARITGVGVTVLDGVRSTRRVVNTNTNLGILLLLAPLAAVPPLRIWTHEQLLEPETPEDLRQGVERILSGLDIRDSKLVFEAIRLAGAGGMGRQTKQDIHSEPTEPLREIMDSASERDLIARQYANGYCHVFGYGLAGLQEGLEKTGSLEGATLFCHLHWMASYPDSLIARKRGQAEAMEAARRAKEVLDLDWPATVASRLAFRDLDAWLRAEGHSRNPGTTADLVTASLFVALRTGIMKLPTPIPWSAGVIDHE